MMVGIGGIFNSVLLGVLIALALKHRNSSHSDDELGHWRWIAGAAGAAFPFTEVFLYLISAGAMAQGMRGLTWSLLLLPVYAVGTAGFLAMLSRKSWELLLTPVIGGLIAAWVLAVLSEPGLFPLALLVDWRVGLAVLNSFDIILFVLCAVGVGMAYAFKQYDRDLSRLTLMGVIAYVVMVGFWSWQAHAFGESYAKSLNLAHTTVRVEPQALSSLNWRVVVSEPNGRVHATRITLSRGGSARTSSVAESDPFKPRDEAVWKIYRRYGGKEVSEETQRQVRLAWYGWQSTAYGWLGRFSVFERMYLPQEVGIGETCVGFRDIRAESKAQIERGTYVVCPGRTQVRVFQPDGRGMMRELVAYEGVRY